MGPGKGLWYWLAALAGLLALYRVYDGWLAEALLLAALAVPLLSLLLSLPGLLTVRLRLESGGAVLRGQPGEVRIRLTRPRWTLPLPLRVRLSLVNRRTGSVQLWNVRGTLQSAIPLDTERCGVIRCTMERARCYDLLRLIFVCPGSGGDRLPDGTRTGSQAEVLVLPRPLPPAVEPELEPETAAELRPKYGGGFAEDHDLREYRPGDPLNSLHWKASAKLDQPVVREPLVPLLEDRLVTFSPDPARLDQTLDLLYWLCLRLSQRGDVYRLGWKEGAEDRWVSVTAPEEVQPAFFQLLSARPDGVPAVDRGAALCRFHVENGEVAVL